VTSKSDSVTRSRTASNGIWAPSLLTVLAGFDQSLRTADGVHIDEELLVLPESDPKVRAAGG
jgi:hypothetical protein